MITQNVRHPSLKGFRGILLILAIMASVLVIIELAGVIRLFADSLVSTVFAWVMVGAIALFVMKRYVIEYRYSIDAYRLRVDRLYGERPRFMLEIPRANVLKWGPAEHIRAEYPGARLDRAALSAVETGIVALAYKAGDKTRILIFQPDERIRLKLGIK